jgi:hypothetical protein
MSEYFSEWLNTGECLIHRKAKDGIKNNQNYVKVDPVQLEEIMISLDKSRIAERSYLKTISKYETELTTLKEQLDAIKSAAHMPDDYEFGLPSWINQYLYASWIGLIFNPKVIERIESGKITFRNAPVYTKLAEVTAERDALKETGRWIPVSFSTPSCGYVIAYNRLTGVDPSYFDGEQWHTETGEIWENNLPTHWRPLPQPPEVKE